MDVLWGCGFGLIVLFAVIKRCIADLNLKALVFGVWVIVAGIFMGVMDASAAHYVAINNIVFGYIVSNILMVLAYLSVIGTAFVMAAIAHDITGEW